jgi:hypothetical protein
MVLTLPFTIGGVTLADAGNLAVRPAASLAAVNGYGFTLGPFRCNRAKHDCKQRSRVGAVPSRLRRRGLGRGDPR